MRFRPILLGAAAISIGVVASLTLVEVGLQIFYRGGYGSPMPPGIRDASGHRLNYVRLRPGFSGSAEGIDYRTNALGLRDDPLVPNARHVVFLGDSTTFGLGLQHDETYPERVEKRLNTHTPELWQSVNAASPGQATLDQRDIWMELLQRKDLNIQLCVLGFFLNDFVENHTYVQFKDQYAVDPLFRFKFILYQSRTVLFLKEFTKELIYYFDRRAVYTEAENKNTETGGTPTAEPARLDGLGQYRLLPGKEIEWDWVGAEKLPDTRIFKMTADALQEIASAAKGRGIPFILLYLPHDPRELASRYEPQFKIALRNLAAAMPHIAFVDSVASYKLYFDQQNGGRPLPGFTGHMGPRAADVLAHALATQMAVMGLGKE